MIIKIIGIVLVMISASLIGCTFAECMASRERELLNLADAAELLIDELGYSMEPVKTLFVRVTPYVKGTAGDMFEQLSQHINDGMSAKDAWCKSLDEMSAIMSLKKSDCTFLKGCAEAFYAHEAEQQKAQLEALRDKIKRLASEAGDIKRKNSRLARMLGVYGGVLICAVLF